MCLEVACSHPRHHRFGELSIEYILATLNNRPQNFLDGQRTPPPGQYFCNKRCGAVLRHGELSGLIEKSQIDHDWVCPEALAYVAWLENYKNVTVNLLKERSNDVPAATCEVAKHNKGLCFVSGLGHFRPSKKALEKSLLDLDISKIKPPKPFSRRNRDPAV